MEMKVVAAYLLAVLDGNSSRSADDLVSILESVGAESDIKRINQSLEEVKGKDIMELIAAGREKFASIPTGGALSAVAVAAPGGGAGVAPVAEDSKKEDKVEEKEESDADMGFNLFD